MKKKSLRKFKHRAYMPHKDSEGNILEAYSDEIHEDEALIWPAGSKLQTELYGLRINSIMNMHYYGILEIEEHDMIIYEGISHKVISVKKSRRFRGLEIERL
ncbi:hypothetical protein [Candidatus Stoquefichus massiliensis]|uniref:hypothetical protein n=1 Tax=Candidatus Stoquefichus massiliensis TaxID=1470350 RepID=UPI0004817D86|nr:hypothetical protein [Candidatus Stoquefichus massiliensis]